MPFSIPHPGIRLLSILLPGTLRVRQEAANKELVLTFDDGPHPENTPRILDILESRNITASFFLIGALAERNPQIVQELYGRGHQVCNHGYHHLDATRHPLARVIDDMQQCQRLLEALCGGNTLPKLFRPPFGKVTPQSLLAARRAGFQIVMWTRDSRDSHEIPSESVLRAVTGSPLQAGSILLFHDDYQQTLRLLPGILDTLLERGYRFMPLLETASGQR